MFVVPSFIIISCLQTLSRMADATDKISDDISTELLRIISKDNQNTKPVSPQKKYKIPLITIPTSNFTDFFDYFNRLTDEFDDNNRRSNDSSRAHSNYEKDRNDMSNSKERAKYENDGISFDNYMQQNDTVDATIAINIEKPPSIDRYFSKVRKQNDVNEFIQRRNYRDQNPENLEKDIINENQKTNNDNLEENSDTTLFRADDTTFWRHAMNSNAKFFTQQILIRPTMKKHPRIIKTRIQSNTQFTKGMEIVQYVKDKNKILIRMKLDKNDESGKSTGNGMKHSKYEKDGSGIYNGMEHAKYEKDATSIGYSMEHSNHKNNGDGIGNSMEHANYDNFMYEKAIDQSFEKPNTQNEVMTKVNNYYEPGNVEKVIDKSFEKLNPEDVDVNVNKYADYENMIDKFFEKLKPQDKDTTVNKYTSNDFWRRDKAGSFETVINESFENLKPQNVEVNVNKYSDKDFRRRYVPGNFDSMASKLDDMAENLENLAENSYRPVNIRM
ncbi:hypothetical protein O0L34_g10407 [Tuta absoluta]|nr:hypothetical protein O0L34_g10407 [Tuta absoluta]